jgi:hypothetical protein
MLTDMHFWVGLLAGVILVWLWHKYQMKKAGQ